MRLFGASVLLSAMLAVSVNVSAGGQSVLAGFVRDSGTRAVLVDAEVLIPQLQLRARTDVKGRYVLEDIPSGRHTVVVRKLGYDSASAAVPFSGADDVTRDFVLMTYGQPLPAVPVTGASAPISNAKLREFDRRRSSGIGRFLTPMDMEKLQEWRLSDVVARMPGTVIVRPKSGRGSSSAAYVASSRGMNTIENVSANFGRNCGVAVWLDGVAVYRGLDRMSSEASGRGAFPVFRPTGTEEPPFDINSITTRQVSAIEFYAGPAQMPAELNVTQGTCGALVIWTK